MEAAGEITLRTVGTVLIASWPRRIAVGLVLLIPVLVASFGGFRTAEPETNQVETGVLVDLGSVQVQPTAFFISDETARLDLEFAEAQAWVGVIVTVTNLIEQPVNLTFPGPASDSVTPVLPEGRLVDPEASIPNTAFRVADGSNGTIALPDVTTEVALLFPVNNSDDIGDVLTINMTEKIWAYGPLSGENVWMSLGDVWVMDLPRVDMPDVLYEEPQE